MATQTTPTAAPLTPERTVEVAHALISEHGLDWFSMRKLAAALDVNPMTVYLRFRNKDELLDAVARHALATIELPELPEAPWEVQALHLATSLRAHLLADRNLLQVFATSGRLSSALLQAVDQGLELMERAGYEGDDAVLAFRSLFWHTVGFTLVDASDSPFAANAPGGIETLLDDVPAAAAPAFSRYVPHFTTVDGDQLFTHTTRLLVAGLLAEATRNDSRKTTP